MFKTILAFIKAHTIATAITTTVVVSTAVATPVIINQVQKQPEQEVSQVQENVVDNSNIIEDNTITEIETNEVNNEIVNEVSNEANNEVETPKENKPNNTQTTSKPNKIQETDKPVGGTPEDLEPGWPEDNKPTEEQPSKLPAKMVTLANGMKYDENNKLVYMQDYVFEYITKDEFINSYYPYQAKFFNSSLEYNREQDIKNGYHTKDRCLEEIAKYAQVIYRTQSALEYFKLHENEIQLDANNHWTYEGYTYNNYIPDFERDIRLAETNKATWEQELKTAQQYRPFRN